MTDSMDFSNSSKEPPGPGHPVGMPEDYQKRMNSST